MGIRCPRRHRLRRRHLRPSDGWASGLRPSVPFARNEDALCPAYVSCCDSLLPGDWPNAVASDSFDRMGRRRMSQAAGAPHPHRWSEPHRLRRPFAQCAAADRRRCCPSHWTRPAAVAAGVAVGSGRRPPLPGPAVASAGAPAASAGPAVWTCSTC